MVMNVGNLKMKNLNIFQKYSFSRWYITLLQNLVGKFIKGICDEKWVFSALTFPEYNLSNKKNLKRFSKNLTLLF